MTVRELIAKLQTMPQDAAVLYRCCSDYSILESGEIVLRKADDELVALRGGKHMTLTRKQYPANETPVFVDAVIFPGN